MSRKLGTYHFGHAVSYCVNKFSETPRESFDLLPALIPYSPDYLEGKFNSKDIIDTIGKPENE